MITPIPQQSPYAVRKIDVEFTLGTGDFGAAGQNRLTISGARVYAHVQNVVAPHMSADLSLRIYGMTLDHINAISVAGLLWAARENRIKVDAGDEVSGMTTVFDGLIYEAYPNFDGDADSRHFYVVGIASRIAQLKPVPASSYPGSVPAAQVIETLAKQAGFTLKNDGVTAVLASPYFWGTAWQQIQAAVRAANCYAGLDSVSKTLTIWPKDAAPGDVTVTVSKETGMIGYPRFQDVQVIVRTMFNPIFNLSPGTSVSVKSDLKAADGKIRLTFISHELSSQMPGGPWETLLIGVRAP